jgi:hypothetical protein
LLECGETSPGGFKIAGRKSENGTLKCLLEG